MKIKYYPVVLLPPHLQEFLLCDRANAAVRGDRPMSLQAPQSERIDARSVSFSLWRLPMGWRLGAVAGSSLLVGIFLGKFGALALFPLALVLAGIGLLVWDFYQRAGADEGVFSDFEGSRVVREQKVRPSFSPPPEEIESPELRLKRLISLSKDAVQPPGDRSSAPRGASESFFWGHLQAIFGSLVHFGHEMPIPDCDYCYSTDFSLIWGDCLYFDLEIDEAYTGTGKGATPTHCSGLEKEERRDRYFRDRGWIVIRFAEEQIVRHPKECCKVIAEVFAQLSGEPSYLEALRDVRELRRVRGWNVRESRQRARDRYRERLLAEIGIVFSRKKKHRKRC